MSVTKKEQQTILYYDEHAHDWAANHGSRENKSFWASELFLFQEYVPQGNILEIGFGAAVEAAVFINGGYVYTGIDPSDALLKIAQKKFPYATFINSSVYDINLPGGSFDGFWSAAVLLHIPKEKIDVALQKIKYVMKAGAIGFISLAEGDGEYFDEKTGRYFYLYGESEFADILQKNGFAIERLASRTPNPKRTWFRDWLTFFVKVNK